jgi:hypothetical protein
MVPGGYNGVSGVDKSANVTSWRTSWSSATGGAPTAVTASSVTGNPRSYSFSAANNYVGIEFLGANTINIAGTTRMHLDVWTDTALPNFQVKLVGDNAAKTLISANNGTEINANATITTGFTVNGWTSIDLLINGANFQNGNANSPSAFQYLGQIVFTVPTLVTPTIYIDNFYFY